MGVVFGLETGVGLAMGSFCGMVGVEVLTASDCGALFVLTSCL